MFHPLALFVGLRYTRTRRDNQFISFVSLISLLGMILGVVALVVVMSVMNGFQVELRDRILSLVPHAYASGPGQKISDWPQWQQRLQSEPMVAAAAPFIDGTVMLSRPGIMRGARLQAIDPDTEKQVSNIHQQMLQGSTDQLEAGDYRIVLGDILARNLAVGMGDEISVLLPRVTVTPVGVFPRIKRFQVAGIFQVGADLDGNTVFIHLRDGQKLFQYGDQVKGLRLQFDDLLKADIYAKNLSASLPAGTEVVPWMETQGSLFSAVAMEKNMVSLLLLIIVVIAAFNIVSILTMMVADKNSDIAVLRTMGASPATIMRVFVVQGLMVGVAGIVIGLAIGIPLALHIGDIVIWLESLTGQRVFNPEIYFISHIPSVVEWKDILLISGCGFFLSLLATLYPSLRASRVQPAEALSYG